MYKQLAATAKTSACICSPCICVQQEAKASKIFIHITNEDIRNLKEYKDFEDKTPIKLYFVGKVSAHVEGSVSTKGKFKMPIGKASFVRPALRPM